MITLHYVSLPHTRVEPAFCGCAYTAKVLKFCRMMGAQYRIFLYAPYGPPVEGATLDPCLSDSKRQEIFGADDPARLPDWPTDAQSGLFNRNVIERIKSRIEPHDIILLSGGLTHKAIAEAFPTHMVVEPGIGYAGVLGGAVWGAYESYWHMAQVYQQHGWGDIRWFDSVIPPYFDPTEFPSLNRGNGDYLLFLGRLINRKGPHIAGMIAAGVGMPLVVAGAGCKEFKDGEFIVANDGTRIEGNVRYIGAVGVEERAQVLAGAKALLVPTTYGEPGGNVVLEALACGTPVISTDFGVFSETVDARSGVRFRTLREGVEAVADVDKLRAEDIRKHAAERYSLPVVGEMYARWFDRLTTLWHGGWYDMLDRPPRIPPPLSASVP